MRIAAKTMIFALVCTAMGFAQTPEKSGAWSIYPATGNLAGTTLVQTQSDEQFQNIQGVPVRAKLDVVCRKWKVAGIALETNSAIAKDATSYLGAVGTTQVAFNLSEGSNATESWAVLDEGYTVSPYSEAFQGRLNRHWIERLSGMEKLSLQFRGADSDNPIQATFNTEGLSEALASAGCKY